MIASNWKKHRHTRKYGAVVPCTRTALVNKTRRSECYLKSDEDEDDNFRSITVERRRVAKKTIGPRTERCGTPHSMTLGDEDV